MAYRKLIDRNHQNGDSITKNERCKPWAEVQSCDQVAVLVRIEKKLTDMAGRLVRKVDARFVFVGKFSDHE